MNSRYFLIAMFMFSMTLFSSGQKPFRLTPEEVIQTYVTALTNLDHDSYLSAIIPSGRDIYELASPEAMRFWHEELQDIIEKGFSGKFEIVYLPPKNEYGQADAIAVFLDHEGNSIGAVILLKFEVGSWWALYVDEYLGLLKLSDK